MHMAEKSPGGAVSRPTNGCGHLALQKAFAWNSKQNDAVSVHCHYVPADITLVNYTPYTAPTHVRHTLLSTQGFVQRNPSSPVDDNSYTATSCAAYLSRFQKKSIYLLRKPANPHKGSMWPSRHRILRLKLRKLKSNRSRAEHECGVSKRSQYCGPVANSHRARRHT